MDQGLMGLIQRINGILSPIPGIGFLGGPSGMLGGLLGGPLSTLGGPASVLGGLFGGQQQINPLAMLFNGLFGAQQQPAAPQTRPQRSAENRAVLLGR